MSGAAQSLSQFEPDQLWWEQLFAVIDARDADGFVDALTPDAEFRFGNALLVRGRAAIHSAVAGFFATIAGSQHRCLKTWAGSGTAVCEGEVTYTRRDGTQVTLPFANVFELRGDRVAAYRIYIDNTPLFAPR